MEIPKEITLITNVLETNGFPAYLVGGCVRDFYLGRVPKDWDITTSATPEEIQKIFPVAGCVTKDKEQNLTPMTFLIGNYWKYNYEN